MTVIQIKGKNYIELSFISSIIGSKYGEKIQDIAEQIGWDIGITNSTNQNEVIALAERLCSEQGISLSKNPSFRPNDLAIFIKPIEIDESKLDEIKKQFDYKTGCKLEW